MQTGRTNQRVITLRNSSSKDSVAIRTPVTAFSTPMMEPVLSQSVHEKTSMYEECSYVAFSF